MDKFRGNDIYIDSNGVCRYSDTHESTVETWLQRPCGHCLKPNRKDEHDACLGELPGVINACCGHGSTSAAYIQYENKQIERGQDALSAFEKLKTT